MESYSRPMARILPRTASIGRAAVARVGRAAVVPVGRATAVALGCAALRAACGEESTQSPPSGSVETPAASPEDPAASPEEPAASTKAPAPSARRGPLVKLRDSQLGPVLFSGSDRA